MNPPTQRLSAPFKELGLESADLGPIIAAYTAPDRFYHNLAHILNLLEVLEKHDVTSPEAEIAIIYHDVVYDTRSNSNEVSSADWAKRDLRDLGASFETITLVTSAITATDHKNTPTVDIQKLVADADLSILGCCREDYIAYCEGIRREYAWVPDREFWLGRSAFLSGLLKKDFLFHTADFRREYGLKAVENIERERSSYEALLNRNSN